jgi:phage-related protein
MGTTPITAGLAARGVGAEVKAFFSKLGKEIEDIGDDVQKAISAANKDIPAIEPILDATLQEIFPKAAIPVQAVEKVIGVALNASSQVATALQSEGLSPTADQVAAVAVAGVVHSLKVAPAAPAKAVPSA